MPSVGVTTELAQNFDRIDGAQWGWQNSGNQLLLYSSLPARSSSSWSWSAASHMCCGCAHHVVQPLAVRRDIHLLRALLTVRLTRIGSSVACRRTPMLCSHHWKGRSSCWLRVGSVLARRATDEQISAPCSMRAPCSRPRVGVGVNRRTLSADIFGSCFLYSFVL